MCDDCNGLEERVAHLEAKVKRLERRLDIVGPLPGVRDHRDAAVVERLDEGQLVTVDQLRMLYQRHTDVHDSDTLRSRVKALTSRAAFEDHDERGVWRFVGADGGEEDDS